MSSPGKRAAQQDAPALLCPLDFLNFFHVSGSNSDSPTLAHRGRRSHLQRHEPPPLVAVATRGIMSCSRVRGGVTHSAPTPGSNP